MIQTVQILRNTEGYVYVNKYVTDDKGKIEIVFNKNSMTHNTQYYVVETKVLVAKCSSRRTGKHISTLVRWIRDKYPVAAQIII